MDDSILKSMSDYEKWVMINSPGKFSLFDYLNGVFRSKDLEPDLAVAFLKLFWPDFVIVRGLVFLQEEYSESRYEELVKQGNSKGELEYWMNLISIDGMFEAATFEQNKYLSRQLTDVWKVKLSQEFPDKIFITDCLIDGDEVYSVFYQKSDS